jgi:hypothetical protein
MKYITLSICGLISALLIVNLWRTHPTDPLLKRVFWTLVLCIPCIGWIFYGGMYQVPSIQPPELRAKRGIVSGSGSR